MYADCQQLVNALRKIIGYLNRLPSRSFFRNMPLSAHIRNFPPGAGGVKNSPPEHSTINAPAATSQN